MALVSLKLPPGVWKNGSQYEAKGRYFDANLVRWRNGRLRPVGGWLKSSTTAMSGAPRTILPFRTQSGLRYIAVGTHSKLYLFERPDTAPTDITPTSPALTVGRSIGQVGTGYGAGPFSGSAAVQTMTDTDIAVVDSDPDKFTRAGNDFDTTNFAVKDHIMVSGFTSAENNRAGGVSGAATVDSFSDQNDHTNGEYTNVTLTQSGHTGRNAVASITISGNNVTAMTITDGGSEYIVNDTLTIPHATIGGTGAVTCDVATLEGGTSSLFGENSFYISTIDVSNIVVSTTIDTNSDGTFDAADLDGEPAGDSVTITRARRYGNEDYDLSTDLSLWATTWSLDNWGEDLIACSSDDGKLMYWDPAAANPLGTKAAALTNAPTSCIGALVTAERHLMALGAGGNRRKVQWCSQEANTTWSPTSTNTAGDFELETSGTIMQGKRVGPDILVVTDTDAHIINYVGPPYVYGRKKVGDSCGAMSRQSIATYESMACWMGVGSFFVYDGGRVKEIRCDVSEYVFNDINMVHRSLVHAVVNIEYSEIWFYYASGDANEIDRYVIWNFTENWWSIGQLARTCGHDAGLFPNPLSVGVTSTATPGESTYPDGGGWIYTHEIKRTGETARQSGTSEPATTAAVSTTDRELSYGGATTSDIGHVWAETGPLEVGQGENIGHVMSLLTDSDAGQYGVRFQVKSRFTPEGDETASSIYYLDTGSESYDRRVDVRESGRQIALKIESPWDQDWTLGNTRAEVIPGGKR